MDESRQSPYPHLSWFAVDLAIRPPRFFIRHEFIAVTHRLMVTEEGAADLSWGTGAAVRDCHVTGGTLGFFPADSAPYALAITAVAGFRGHEVLVPRTHLENVCQAEGVGQTDEFPVIPMFRDALLLACVLRLLVGNACGQLAEDIGTEITARHVIMRLATIAGGHPPDWLKDTSVFEPFVMKQIVERVDAHLGQRGSLIEISHGFGLSPSHFARKFQQSTGLSLNRFMNRRRIGRSLALLKTSREPLAQLSLGLGFSSQSHFTRLFSSLTGVTPYQFRRAQRRMSD
jgi:AraC-like DNA-binding protein